jgi:hypothetical protein
LTAHARKCLDWTIKRSEDVWGSENLKKIGGGGQGAKWLEFDIRKGLQ